ncbi:MAG: sulfurtransferase [Chloroflexota bacterium]|jgi:thiosulfate/3-mercaptopyruvate sulfurtransferase
MNDAVPDPLISADELLEALNDPGIRVADVRFFLGEPGRGQREYAQGHIPGAVFVDLDRDLAAPPGAGRHPLPDPGAFAARMGELGFGDQHTIIIHDADRGQYGARMWLMLDRLGHRQVRMLDGGIAAWRRVGGPWTVERSSPMRATMTLGHSWRGIVDRADVTWLKGEVDLVDVRAPERYSGEYEPFERIGGHIPGARNCHYGLLMTEDGRMKPADEVRHLIRGQGERAAQPLVISCGSGVTACYGALAARVAGLPDPLIYAGSFSDWVGHHMPVARGSEPDGQIITQ